MVDRNARRRGFARITVGHSVTSANGLPNRIAANARVDRAAHAFTVTSIAFAGREPAELTFGTKRAEDAAACLHARSEMIDGHRCRRSFAGISIGFAITAAHGLVYIGAGGRNHHTNAHIVGDVAFPRREFAEFTLGAGDARDAAAIAVAIGFHALGHEAAGLDRAFILGASFFDASIVGYVALGGTSFFAAERAVFRTGGEEMLGSGLAIVLIAAFVHALVVTLAGLHGAALFAGDDAVIFDALLKKLTGGLSACVFGSAVMAAFAIKLLSAMLALATAVCVGHAAAHAFFHESLPGLLTLAL